MLERRKPRQRGLASRTATAATLITFVALGMATVWLATNGVDSHDGAGSEHGSLPREAGVGACLSVAHPPLTDAWAGIEVLEQAAATHGHLFPALGTVTVPPRPLERGTVIALWPNGAPSPDVAADEASRADAACAAAQAGWALRITRELLADGADRLLEQAEFGDEWSGRIEVSFHPRQSRVRTKLDFKGPLGVEGTCSVDETFVIDLETGRPDVISKNRNDAGIVGLVACRRFEDELAGGGAGAQALALLPAALTEGATDPALTLARIDVSDDMVSLSGTTR